MFEDFKCNNCISHQAYFQDIIYGGCDRLNHHYWYIELAGVLPGIKKSGGNIEV